MLCSIDRVYEHYTITDLILHSTDNYHWQHGIIIKRFQLKRNRKETRFIDFSVLLQKLRASLDFLWKGEVDKENSTYIIIPKYIDVYFSLIKWREKNLQVLVAVHINVSTFLIWALYRAIYSIWLRLKDSVRDDALFACEAHIDVSMILSIRDMS